MGPAGSNQHIIFRPLSENVDARRPKELMAAKAMTDHGDHVVWDDGKKQWRWRLPDQVDSGALFPVLNAVVLGGLHSTVVAPAAVSRYFIVFTDPSGMILGRLTGSPTTDLAAELVDLALPPAAWRPLEDRGVLVTHEYVATMTDFYRRHPDHTIKRRLGVAWWPVGGARGAEARRRTGRVET